ncbi:MAG TPA: hypothetical protein VKP08_07965 [Anaerolineales bacterium]|nr:hypothetical protein [Anaerolineales bacterium]
MNMLQSSGDSFSDLKVRIKRQMQSENVNDYILGLIKSAYERAFDAQKVVLSKQEKEILLKNVTKDILTDLVEQFKP